MKRPEISVCKTKQGVKVGCFNEFVCIRDFIFYINESQGIKEAREFFSQKGIDGEKVAIVRPIITKMTMRS